jgi:hypothetical protein
MTLGLFDSTDWTWLGSNTYQANQVAAEYVWVRSASAVAPKSHHRIVFIAQFSSHVAPLSTDWFVDGAVMAPAGSPPPFDLQPAYANP